MRFRNVVYGLVLFCGCCAAAGAADKIIAGKIKLALNWVAEPEFGGIYAAQLNGDFKRNGLEVEILPGGAGAPTWQLVGSAQADYAIASADEVLIARRRGADIVAIFATYQTCPQGIMAHASRKLSSLADVFSGGMLAVEPGLPYVTFLKNKYGFDKVKLIAYDGGIGAFLADKDLAQQCFITSEPISAARRGAKTTVFLIAEAGYNPYTAVVITTARRVKEHPREIQAMMQALQAGWRSYLDNPAATNELMGKMNRSMDQQTIQQAAEVQKPLIETEQTKAEGLGSMTLQRWTALADQLLQMKILDQAVPPQDCFINPPKP